MILRLEKSCNFDPSNTAEIFLKMLMDGRVGRLVGFVSQRQKMDFNDDAAKFVACIVLKKATNCFCTSKHYLVNTDKKVRFVWYWYVLRSIFCIDFNVISLMFL